MSWFQKFTAKFLFLKKFTRKIFDESEKSKTNTFYYSKRIHWKVPIKFPIIFALLWLPLKIAIVDLKSLK